MDSFRKVTLSNLHCLFYQLKKQDTGYVEHEKYKDGTLTIGCVGQPNVGKSSLLNAIMGKKVGMPFPKPFTILSLMLDN